MWHLHLLQVQSPRVLLPKETSINLTNLQGQGIFRDRSSNLTFGLTDGSHSLKQKKECWIASSCRRQSPPAYIFLSGIPNGTTKEYIVDDLDEADIKITANDKNLMSRPRETLNTVSYRVSVAAEDLQKSLLQAVWPLRVHVREFILYRKGYSERNAFCTLIPMSMYFYQIEFLIFQKILYIRLYLWKYVCYSIADSI